MDGSLSDRLRQTLGDEEVHAGHDGQAGQRYEDGGPVHPEAGLVEPVPQRQDYGERAQETHRHYVGHLGVRLAVEAVVQPGYDGSHDEEGDAGVVEATEQGADSLRVAAEGVKQGRAGQAQNGSNEESQEDQLLR